MPRTAIPTIPLYAHDPQDALAILAAYLPHSIPVIGTLVSSIPPRGDTSTAPRPIPIPYFTFPPGSTPLPSLWTAIVPPPSPQSDLIRCFCNLESKLTPLVEYSSAPTVSKEDQDEATAQVIGALLAYEKINSDWSLVGALNTVWEQPVRECLGGSKRGFCSVWLPPREALEPVAKGETRAGWVVDIARELDVSAYQHSSDIARNASYYRDRLFRSTVIRPTFTTYRPVETPLHIKGTIFEPPPNEGTEQNASTMTKEGETYPAAAMILTHLDGAIGALHTSPEYQRLGLARWVVREHLRNGRGVLYPSVTGPAGSASSETGKSKADGHDSKGKEEEEEEKGHAWGCIFHGNVASESLFRSMGWSEEWDVAWVNRGLRDTSEVRRVFKRALGKFQHPPSDNPSADRDEAGDK